MVYGMCVHIFVYMGIDTYIILYIYIILYYIYIFISYIYIIIIHTSNYSLRFHKIYGGCDQFRMHSGIVVGGQSAPKPLAAITLESEV